jgi:hypothetical protein
MAQVGRPNEYTQELADLICEGITLGYSVRTVLRPDSMPAISTFYRWIRENDEFQKQYARATEERTEAMSEDLLDIADDGSNDYMEAERKDGSSYLAINSENIQRSRLRVDTRKWLMSKMKPKKYGEKLDVVSDGEKLRQSVVIYRPEKLNDDITEE